MAENLAARLRTEQNRLAERSREIAALRQALSERVAGLQRRADELRARARAAERDLDRLPARAVWEQLGELVQTLSELAAAQREEATLAERQRSIEATSALLRDALDGSAGEGDQPSTSLEELDRVAASLVEAQEEERKRVSRQLHDGPAQALSNLVLRAEICERLLAGGPEEARAELTRLKQLAASTLRETRQFIFDLRPMILDDLGLVPTIRRYLSDRFAGTGLSVEVRVLGRERRLPAFQEITLFRVVQTAVANVAAHARVSEATVTVTFGEEEVRVEVADKGLGFDVERTLPAVRERRGSGLGLLAERVRLLGGELRIESVPGGGTTVSVSVPPHVGVPG